MAVSPALLLHVAGEAAKPVGVSVMAWWCFCALEEWLIARKMNYVEARGLPGAIPGFGRIKASVQGRDQMCPASEGGSFESWSPSFSSLK